MYTVKSGVQKKNVKIKMKPDVYGLQDIVVTPKNQKQKYKRKGNPAVELIKNVIAHKDSFQVKSSDHYRADTDGSLTPDEQEKTVSATVRVKPVTDV